MQKTHVSDHSYEFAKRWINFKERFEWTGLPLNGIYSNIRNPIIVYTILFDYFFIKQNFFSYPKTLVDFVTDLYKGLKLVQTKTQKNYSKNSKGRKNSKDKSSFIYKSVPIQKFIERIKIHDFCLKHIFGLISEEGTRRFLCHYIVRDDYVIPTKRDLIAEIFKLGMFDKVSSYTQNIRKLSDDLFNHCPFPDKNDYNKIPLFVSIFNNIQNVKDAFKESRVKGCFDIIENFTVVDFSKVKEKRRDKISNLLTVGNCFLEGVNHINKTDEIYYGSSYQTSTFELDDTGATSRMLINNIDFYTSQLKSIYNGSYLNPIPEEEKESIEDKWANFFK